MPISPIITFKAGQCELDTSSKPHKVSASPKPGYIYLYSEDDLIHFCWRERNVHLDDEENMDLVMVPNDARFVPYEYTTTEQPTSKTNGRIFVLKFTSSSARHLFWLQAKPQGPDPSYFSPRDLRIGDIVDKLLQGDEVDVVGQLASTHHRQDDDGDETMEDAGSAEPPAPGSGGAGPGATGGDIREEGEPAREGGADGARAASSGVTDASTAVQNFLNSLKGSQGSSQLQQAQGIIYTTLPDLLPASTTIPTIESASVAQVDNLLAYLPPALLLIAQEGANSIDGLVEPNAGTTQAALEALNLDQKKTILKRVLRSPQFHQSLGSLTVALRDGGLPSIADALGVKVQNGGLVRGGSVPLGGGEAVEAFVEGVKKSVEEEN